MATMEANRPSARKEAKLALARVGLTITAPRGARRAPETARPGDTRLIEAMADYLESVRTTKRSSQTHYSYRLALRHFAQWLLATNPCARCRDLSHQMADAYLRYMRDEHRTSLGKPLQDTSLRDYVNVLKGFASWGARGNRFFKTSPLRDYSAPSAAEKEIVPLTPDELKKLFEACGSEATFAGRRLRAIFLMALDTGMRRAELCHLRLEMVDPHTGRIRLPAAITKTRRSRTVYLQRAARNAFQLWLEARNALPGVDHDGGPAFCQLTGDAITVNAMNELAARLRVRSDVTRFHWHLMRHTAATESLRNGADSLEVQDMLGHTTIQMTRRYRHLVDDDRRERHAQFSPVQALLERAEPRENRFKRRA